MEHARFASKKHQQVEGPALVVHGDRHHGTVAGEVLACRISFGNLGVVDHPGLVAIEQPAQNSAREHRQAVAVDPRVEILTP